HVLTSRLSCLFLRLPLSTLFPYTTLFRSLDPSGEPATLSKPIINGLLREELGYDGVVVTDSLQMQGVREMHPDSEIPVLAQQSVDRKSTRLNSRSRENLVCRLLLEKKKQE